jgi:glycosyltransferase involved in cell wall biosynthesis
MFLSNYFSQFAWPHPVGKWNHLLIIPKFIPKINISSNFILLATESSLSYNAFMAKIVIDARMWNESGVGRYVRNLVENLQKLDSKNEYFLILLEKDFESLSLNENFHKILGDFKWYGVREQLELPKLLNKIKPDLVHFPHFNVPIFYRGKFVVTIHDLIHQHFQMRRATTRDPLTYKIKHFGYTTIFKNALKKSQKVIVPSKYVKELLGSEWNVVSDKILVTPEAVDDKIFSIGNKMNQKKIAKILEKFQIKSPFTAKQEPSGFIYYVGNAHPHKNVEGLVKAFMELRKKYQYLQLVLSGNDHYFWQKIKDRYQHPSIIYTGFVSEEELVALYKSAKVYVVPSFEEGFGIPLLEAMAIGCPVASSNIASLPEVGGNAALYFNPQDIDDIVGKISNILNDNKLRTELIEKGKKRVKLFSWQKMTEQTLEIYQKCV